MILTCTALIFSLIITNVVPSPLLLSAHTCSPLITLGDDKQVSIFDVFKLHQCTPSEYLINLYSDDVPVSTELMSLCKGLGAIMAYGEEHKLFEKFCPDGKEEYCQMYSNDMKQSRIEKLFSSLSKNKFPTSYINALSTLSTLNGESCRVVCGDERSEMCSVLVQLGESFTEGTQLKSNISSDLEKKINTSRGLFKQQDDLPHVNTGLQILNRHNRQVTNGDNNQGTGDQQSNKKIDVLGESPEDNIDTQDTIKHNEGRSAVNYPQTVEEQSHKPTFSDEKPSQNIPQSMDDLRQLDLAKKTEPNILDNNWSINRKQSNFNRQPLTDTKEAETVSQNDQQEHKANSPELRGSIFNEINAALPRARRPFDPINHNRQSKLSFAGGQPTDLQRSQNSIDGKPIEDKPEHRDFTGEQPKDSQPGPFTGEQPKDSQLGPLTGEQPKDSQLGPLTGEQPKDSLLGPFTGEQPKDSQSGPFTGEQPKESHPGPFTGEQPRDSQPGPFTGEQPKDSQPGPLTGEQPKDSQPGPFTGEQPKDSQPGPSAGEQPKDTQKQQESIDGKSSEDKPEHFTGEQPKPGTFAGEQPKDIQPGSFTHGPPSDSQKQQGSIDGKPSEDKPEHLLDEQPKDTQPGPFTGEQPKDSQRQQESIDGRPIGDKPEQFTGEQSKDSQPGPFIGEQPKDSQRPGPLTGEQPKDSQPAPFIGEQPEDSQRQQESIDGKTIEDKPEQFTGEQPKDSQPGPLTGEQPKDTQPRPFADEQPKDTQRQQESIDDKPSEDKLEPFEDDQSKEPLLPASVINNDDPLLTDDKTQPELKIDSESDDQNKDEANSNNDDVKTGIEENISDSFHETVENSSNKKKEDKDENAITDEKPSSSQPTTTKQPISTKTESSFVEDVTEYQGYGTYHFLSIFVFIAILVIVGYFLVHYRRKIQGGIIAYSEKGHRRHQYRPLSQQ